MISRKPLGERNDIGLPQKDATPEKRKESQRFEPLGRTISADSGFVSPETICLPKSSSRRSSPAINVNRPFTSFRFEDASDSCHVADSQLPSKAISDLWNLPLKFTGAFSTKTPRPTRLCSDDGSRKNELPPTKLLFDSCESSADESPTSSPVSFVPAPSLGRKSKGYRRSLSYTEPEYYKHEAFPKRHKLDSDGDENSPYKTYSEASSAPPTIEEVVEPLCETKKGNASSSLTPEVKRLCFARSQSESALTPSCSIKRAVERIDSNPNLIGDGSRTHILPITMNGKHQDLKEITGNTLTELLEGKLKDSVTTFKVIDCRYPYEFVGGHIKGAINLFSRKQIYEHLIQPKISEGQPPNEEDRSIIIFHCEFSSLRGPDMCRYLRDSDRASNISTYPSLYYPELYVLFGGYKAYFENFSQLCEPQAYTPMDHPRHVEDCRRFKSQAKLEIPTSLNDRSKNKAKSQSRFSRTASFTKKCNF